jgi:hypothetical protein
MPMKQKLSASMQIDRVRRKTDGFFIGPWDKSARLANRGPQRMVFVRWG